MAGLCFKFSELIDATRMLKEIARDFLDPNTTYALDQLRNSLEGVWSANQDQEFKLKLSELRTNPSKGDYEISNRKGKLEVYAAITGTWDVRPLGDNPKKQKAKMKRLLEFCDIASTKVELYDCQNPTRRLAMWRMELGAEDHPGSYFHIQVLGDSNDLPFPKAIPVPRLPSMFVTPMVVVEYVLGELFQDRWHETVARDIPDVTQWRELQRKRFRRLFDWHKEQLDKRLSSPWMNLKAAKPDGRMFLD